MRHHIDFPRWVVRRFGVWGGVVRREGPAIAVAADRGPIPARPDRYRLAFAVTAREDGGLEVIAGRWSLVMSRVGRA